MEGRRGRPLGELADAGGRDALGNVDSSLVAYDVVDVAEGLGLGRVRGRVGEAAEGADEGVLVDKAVGVGVGGEGAHGGAGVEVAELCDVGGGLELGGGGRFVLGEEGLEFGEGEAVGAGGEAEGVLEGEGGEAGGVGGGGREGAGEGEVFVEEAAEVGGGRGAVLGEEVEDEGGGVGVVVLAGGEEAEEGVGGRDQGVVVGDRAEGRRDEVLRVVVEFVRGGEAARGGELGAQGDEAAAEGGQVEALGRGRRVDDRAERARDVAQAKGVEAGRAAEGGEEVGGRPLAHGLAGQVRGSAELGEAPVGSVGSRRFAARGGDHVQVAPEHGGRHLRRVEVEGRQGGVAADRGDAGGEVGGRRLGLASGDRVEQRRRELQPRAALRLVARRGLEALDQDARELGPAQPLAPRQGAEEPRVVAAQGEDVSRLALLSRPPSPLRRRVPGAELVEGDDAVVVLVGVGEAVLGGGAGEAAQVGLPALVAERAAAQLREPTRRLLAEGDEDGLEVLLHLVQRDHAVAVGVEERERLRELEGGLAAAQRREADHDRARRDRRPPTLKGAPDPREHRPRAAPVLHLLQDRARRAAERLAADRGAFRLAPHRRAHLAQIHLAQVERLLPELLPERPVRRLDLTEL
mmetsp:Transcript_10745/g.34378  ORF Transcript_10745/g.34378 Transcript_10745/m.34378 type:complete len:634 (-) Transcript_10745:299-2200(-)